MNQAEIVLQRSLQQCRQLLTMAQGLEPLLAGDPGQLQAYLGRFNAAQAQLQQTDSQLQGLLTAELRESPLLYERLALLQQLVELNARLLPKIHGIKALTAAELEQLKGGRVAVSGYGGSSKKHHGASRGMG